MGFRAHRDCGGIDIFAGHATHLQPKIAVTVDEVVAREPDLIIGSWCDENFRSEW
jgi:hypothetical protein